ncbi:glycine betaine/L-proline ABC transporter substrate-binding protein ProX [Aeromonas sp. sif2416]|uniref:glycine betaine/L-proline ABC transporter substrate-binding protein ProX n=1 Tax=Aeromonas sp. sif2416 TaxID=2854793 RepID=UPI001C4597B6|nr:glycine betaine/L-proline ABC transporter substrate-binding protein ProX [Aeromonas sp. sif2416]MBV7436406.1 glycine betaine/L-proline ABC transporter substrate-binding protein ProX [Aeromonas sp. sif2416]
MRRITKSLTLGTLLLSTVAMASTELPGEGVKVQPLQSSLPEEAFQSLLVSKLMTRLGYEVRPAQEVDYNVAYASVAQGDGTFLAFNWIPLQDNKYEQAGGDKVFFRQGTYVAGAAQGYLIDKQTATQYGITNLGQLKDPKLAALFDGDGDGKADLVGCNPGWGCEGAINQHLDEFGLTPTVSHKQGNYAALVADTLARYQSGKPVLYYTWTPYWLSSELVPGRDVVWLEVPADARGADQTRLPNGKNYGFAVNTMHIVANKAFTDTNPAAAKLFSIVKLPLNDINIQNGLMNKGQNKPADVERHADAWLKGHEALVNDWLTQARAAAAQGNSAG